MTTVVSARQKKAVLLEGRGRVLFLVFLVTLVALIIFSVRYHIFTHYTAPASSPLTITGSPGERVFITVEPGNSVNGLWASQEGLTLTLSSSSHFSTQLVAPQARSWSDTITTRDFSDQPMSMTGSFVLPSSIDPIVQSITGQISGEVEYPSTDLYSYFSEASSRINIPVQINLLSSSAVYTNERLPLYLVTCVDIVLLLAVPAFFRLYDARRKQTVVMM